MTKKELSEIKERAEKAQNIFQGKYPASIDLGIIADIPRLIEALEKAIEIIRAYDAEEDSVWELAADAGCILEKRTYKAREFLKEFDRNDRPQGSD